MKVFAPGGVASELEKLTVSAGEAEDVDESAGAAGAGSMDAVGKQPEKSEAGKPLVEVASRMSLRAISMSGMELVENSQEYRALFDGPGAASAWDMKKFELNLEAFLFAHAASASRKSRLDEALLWNFGSAQEESEALASGGKAKLSKVNKQLDGQRLLLDMGFVKEQKLEVQTMSLYFAGPISTLKTSQSIHVTNAFGIDFYVLPIAQPTLANSTVVPAWLVPSTSKCDKATVTENTEEIEGVP